MEYTGMEDDFHSEGSNHEEDLQEPVTKLEPDFFNESYDNTTDLFKKYFKAIKKNRYLLTLIDEVLKEVEPCCVYEATATEDIKGRHKEYPLPSLSGEPQEDNPGASKKIELTQMCKKRKGFQAVSEINAGDNLIVEKASAFLITPNCTCYGTPHFYCYHCGNPVFKFVPCEHCDICVFCDEKCLAEAWETYHEFECYGLHRHFWKDEYSLMAFRMMTICLTKLPTETVSDCMRRFQVFHSLETHMAELSVEELNRILHSSARSLVYLIERTKFFQTMLLRRGITKSKSYYMYVYTGGLLVRFTCAARFGIIKVPLDSVLADVGEFRGLAALAVSENAPMINHKCQPNCIVLNNKNYVIIRAIKRIKPGEEITISYYPILAAMTTDMRLSHCKQLFFECKCNLCSACDADLQLLNAYVCRSCPLGRIHWDGKVLCCVNCSMEYDPKGFIKAEEAADMLHDEYQNSDRLQCAIKVVDAFDQLYYPLHSKLFLIYQYTFKCFLRYRAQFFKGCKVALQAINIHRAHVGEVAMEFSCVVYNTILEVMKHKNFTSAKWQPEHKSMLLEYVEALEDAHQILLFYYELDQLEFLKDRIKQMQAILKKIEDE